MIYILPLITTIVITVITIISTLSRDRFLKITELNKHHAISKILHFLSFIFLSLMFILLISMELSDHFKIDPKTIINNSQFRLYYILVVLFILIVLSVIYISIFINDFFEKNYYFVENYNDVSRKLIILQKYKEQYICTYDSIDNNNRIIINSENLENIELKYHYKDSFKIPDISNILDIKYKTLGVTLFFIGLIFPLLFSILLLFSLVFLNYILDFGSMLLLILSFMLSIAVIFSYLMYLKKSLKNFIKRLKK